MLIHQYSIKPNDTEDSFPDNVEQVFCQFCNFHAINVFGYFTENVGIEDILKLNTGLESWHEVNLMFLWPCIMNWLYIDYQLDAPIIIYS